MAEVVEEEVQRQELSRIAYRSRGRRVVCPTEGVKREHPSKRHEQEGLVSAGERAIGGLLTLSSRGLVLRTPEDARHGKDLVFWPQKLAHAIVRG